MTQQEQYADKLKKLTTRQLKKEHRELDRYIEDGCFGTSDVIRLSLMSRELSRRGK